MKYSITLGSTFIAAALAGPVWTPPTSDCPGVGLVELFTRFRDMQDEFCGDENKFGISESSCKLEVVVVSRTSSAYAPSTMALVNWKSAWTIRRIPMMNLHSRELGKLPGVVVAGSPRMPVTRARYEGLERKGSVQ